MRIRLTGLPEELDAAVAELSTVLRVDEVSRPYPGRNSSRLVSLYLEARLSKAACASSDTPDDKKARDADTDKR
ncbi:hypothetical protein [Actinomadura harenae]|uniref:Uncharacterized protein n=1 Tax=Actinomadura harenae TaxID=2483351 RepID=A0A3M2M8K1_9ACTN|nr:hypothetical protein [Actinomadura harenae]RMI45310.1 hypothetical protein EBO15_10310 [Actinomadura harenae]